MNITFPIHGTVSAMLFLVQSNSGCPSNCPRMKRNGREHDFSHSWDSLSHAVSHLGCGVKTKDLATAGLVGAMTSVPVP